MMLTSRMLDGLAFLPTGDVVAGLQLLRRIAPPEATDLINYFDSTYVNGRYRQLMRNGHNVIRNIPARFPVEDWNVNRATINADPRTNNECEGWNNKFFHLVGYTHPSFWKAIIFLKLEERTTASSIAQHEYGNLQPRKKRRVFIELQTRLQNLCNDYGNQRRNLKEFL